MARSMTGFGRARAQTDVFDVRVEVRSVNNRNLRVSCRLPDALQSLETDLAKRVREATARGVVTVAVTVDAHDAEPEYELDAAVLQRYHEALTKLRKEMGLSAETSLEGLLDLPGVARRAARDDETPEALRRAIEQALDEALARLRASRAAEGEAVWQDIANRCRAIGELVDLVEAKMPELLDGYAARLSERLEQLLARVDSGLSEEEFRREVALFADRSDISEEIARMRSHLNMMDELGKTDEPCGRRMEFLAQEMFREANTMASKAAGATTTRELLEIKNEIEKVREQALNVE